MINKPNKMLIRMQINAQYLTRICATIKQENIESRKPIHESARETCLRMGFQQFFGKST
jgi:hypothetical protein